MKNAIQIFESKDFGKVRVIEIDGVTWFVGKDVTKILGYTNSSKALKDHVDDEDKLNNESLSSLGQRGGWIINESGLYSLILSSKLPTAKAFKRWVTTEVLPSIKRHGVYIHDDILKHMREDSEFADDLIRRLSAEREKNGVLLDYVEHAAPKVRYYDTILQCPDAVQVSIIAKDYGMTAIAFNKLLHRMGVQFKVGKTWVLYKEHQGNGYTITKTYLIDEKASSVHMYFTQKGRFWLYALLKWHGIVPEAEKLTDNTQKKP